MSETNSTFRPILWLVLILPLYANSQFSANVSRDEQKKSFASISGSYGQHFERDAWFYGFSGEFSRRLNKLPIGLAGSLMWDKETDVEKDKVVDTFTAAVTGSYLINDRWSLGTGLGKAFIDTDNDGKKYKFTSGDWSTALFLGYQIPLNLNSSLGLSASYEYNMSANETSLSFDIAYGFNL